MTKRKTKPRSRSGWISRCLQHFKAKWRLQDQVDQFEFECELKDREILDLENRLEAYKDALASLTREFRLKGMLAQADINKIAVREDSE